MLKFPLSRDIMCFKSQVEGRSRGSKIILNRLPPGLLQLISYLVSTWSWRRLGRGYFGGGCGCLGRGGCVGAMVGVIICLSGWGDYYATWHIGGFGHLTVAAFICGNHLTASRAPVFTNVVYLAPVGIIPKREELAFHI